jgi:L-cystine transport system substrate-binding protein
MAFNSHTADIFFDEMDITPEREEVYYFSIPYYKVASNIIVKRDRNDINGLSDLEGKTLGQNQSSNWWAFIENYNKTTAKTPIILVHNGTTIEQTLLAVQYGQFDARIDNPVTATGIINRNKLDLKILPEPVMGENIGLMFAKDENGLKLKNLIDPIIRELENDGTLSRLALEYTGYPYNP